MLYDGLDDLQAEAGLEYQSKLEADRVTAEWRCPITATAPQRSIESLPLFSTGREEQGGLFE